MEQLDWCWFTVLSCWNFNYQNPRGGFLTLTLTACWFFQFSFKCMTLCLHIASVGTLLTIFQINSSTTVPDITGLRSSRFGSLPTAQWARGSKKLKYKKNKFENIAQNKTSFSMRKLEHSFPENVQPRSREWKSLQKRMFFFVPNF